MTAKILFSRLPLPKSNVTVAMYTTGNRQRNKQKSFSVFWVNCSWCQTDQKEQCGGRLLSLKLSLFYLVFFQILYSRMNSPVAWTCVRILSRTFCLDLHLVYFSDVWLKYGHGQEQESNIQEAEEYFANSSIDLSEEISLEPRWMQIGSLLELIKILCSSSPHHLESLPNGPQTSLNILVFLHNCEP